MSLPQGYSNTGDNYKATKAFPVKRSLSGGSKTKNLSYAIDNKTGDIQVSFEDGRPFWEYSAEKNKWTVPSAQDVDNYIEATRIFGDPSSEKWKVIERNGKNDAVSIINDPNATSNRDRKTISQTNGYRSSVDNSQIESDDRGAIGTSQSESESSATAQTSISAELKQLSIQVKPAADEPPSDSLRYPEKIPTGMDTIRFSKFEYTVRRSSGFTFADRQRIDQKQALASVTLGIQDGIKDSNRVGWTGQDLSPLKTAGLDLLYGAATGGKDGAGNSFDRLAKDLRAEGAGNLTSAALSKIAEFALGTNNLTARTTGGIFNPNRELLFDSPNLRDFNFQFYLSPRTPTEATNVKNIIRFFKQGMAPRRSTGELFLKSPHTFGITYLHNNTQNPSLNRIKECALVGCEVDYTPTGSYITFEDGTPVQYVLRMQFQELVPVYEDDYSENEIGY